MDGRDGFCTHFLAESPPGPDRVAMGTVRLRTTPAGDAKLERLAVLDGSRGRGVGTMLIRAVEAEALRRGHEEVVLGAQVVSMAFYESCGYRAEGPVFDDAGIAHRLMRRRLRD